MEARPGKERTHSRFWSKVDKRGDDECWNWTARLNTGGYGRCDIRRDGFRATSAHRASWLLSHGHLPPAPVCILHRCDNRKCVNVAHLFAGTRKDNAIDCAAKGRNTSQVYPGIRAGDNAGHRFLDSEKVRAIRAGFAAGSGVHALAEKYGLSAHYARGIILRKRWKCIE